ncbi:MAG: phosphoglycerate dehydrogenase [Acidobacteriota bacterium]|nr:phosphoglycerate dehydrogenase [Acidobacteriota bacterium]
MYRILVSDPLDESGVELLRQRGAEVHLVNEEEKPRLSELIGGFDALIVRSGTKVTAELLRAAGGSLKVVGRAGIGVDNVDVAAATELGILVVNAPTANLIAATEHTFALLLAVARNVAAAAASVRAGDWDRKRFIGSELEGKTIGVVGLGRIGQAVAHRARAFGMKVLAHDPYLDSTVAHRMEIELAELDELIPRVDVLTMHLPLTDGTRDLINASRVAALKEGAMLINCARGGIVDERALLEGLDSGRLAGVGLDVFAEEPPSNLALVRHPRVVATPHIGAQTREAQERVATQTARMVLDALDGSLTVTAVNLPFSSTGKRGEPFLALGEQLGRLASGLMGGSLRRLQIDLWELDEDLRAPIAVAVVKGALGSFLGETVNFVNAERIAGGRGVEVIRSTHSGAGEYPHLVAVRLDGESGSVALAGTVVGASDLRVVHMEDFRLEFQPQGQLLVIRNKDVPGVVGKLGTLLGRAGANIADIHLARDPAGGDALAVIRLDQEPEGQVLADLAALDEVDSVQHVDLGL